ncbi:membrane protein [Terribacillus saccharophilus]|uniref:Membrane protein n=1 Tax=Terribacillus saccharophilus TaxID=361277 RepID=A0A075LKH9_9BACI|nr:membrane protein [Terribacillus goriensis]AIF67255.1 membrane protein [Terribacillus goriensis]
MWAAGLKWMFLILATLIGAGYASGREIWQFFGYESGLAIIIFTILFTICSYVILHISFTERSTHYFPVLERLVGKKLAAVYDVLIVFYLFTVTVVMIAAGGATGTMYQIPNWLGILFITLMIILIFTSNVEGVVSMNSYILPILVGGLVLVLVIYTRHEQINLLQDWREQANWQSAFPFTALNILPVVAVIGAIGKQMKGKGELWIASIGSGLIIGALTYLYNNDLMHISHAIPHYDIPLFYILKNYPSIVLIGISIVLWLAIYTSAVSGVLGIVSRFQTKWKGPLWLQAAVLVLLMLPLTQLGFTDLIALMYPIFGFANLYILSAILVYPILNRYKMK